MLQGATLPQSHHTECTTRVSVRRKISEEAVSGLFASAGKAGCRSDDSRDAYRPATSHGIKRKIHVLSPYVPTLGKGIACPSLEKVLITWQKDDASPFGAMRLKHETCFGELIDRLATKFSTWFVFKTMNLRYASFLKRNDIEVHIRELDWRPKGSRFGACHCLELSLLFGSWERWKGTGMLDQVNEAE